jgi:phosphoribosyl 1,2-cyclic phosphodiesterase
MSIDVKFWGVRGSFPCATPSHMGFGGNTSCVTVEAGGRLVVLDAGTGLFKLGRDLVKRQVPGATLLLSHSHTDHILGFPFFAPAWNGKFELSVMAGHLNELGGVRAVIADSMRDPVFPVQLNAMGAHIQFKDFRAGESFSIGPDVKVLTAPLNHPNGATAYRIESGHKSVCYVTDTEHTPGKPDENVLNLVRGTDLMIYDSTYTDEEFASHVGWGHSTWQEALRLGKLAGVKQVAIFHHDPDHDDSFMTEVERQARAVSGSSFAAREGMVINL